MAGVGPFKDPIPKETAKQVAAVVPRVQLHDIRLASVVARVGEPPTVPALAVTIEHRSELDLQDERATIRITYELAAKPEGDAKAPSFIAIEATFQLEYTGESLSEVQGENWTTFANVNAVHNSWPYVRELVQNLTGRMGVDPLTVPLLKGTWPPPKPKHPPAKGS